MRPARPDKAQRASPGASDAAAAKWGHGARTSSSRGPGSMKLSEVLVQIRSEVLALEEEVPWSAVTDKWRGARPKWRNGLRGDCGVSGVCGAGCCGLRCCGCDAGGLGLRAGAMAACVLLPG